MPVKSPKQWGFMGLVRSGKIKPKGLTPDKATEFMEKTPKKKRSVFAKDTTNRSMMTGKKSVMMDL